MRSREHVGNRLMNRIFALVRRRVRKELVHYDTQDHVESCVKDRVHGRVWRLRAEIRNRVVREFQR